MYVTSASVHIADVFSPLIKQIRIVFMLSVPKIGHVFCSVRTICPALWVTLGFTFILGFFIEAR